MTKNTPLPPALDATGRPARYQDYVIKDGKLVGDFEGLYKNFDDPWHQSEANILSETRRQIAVNWLHRLRAEKDASRVLELGCGFGHLTTKLRDDGFSAIGVDISQTAIDKARRINPRATFVQGGVSEFDFLAKFSPDVFLMAEITWYILDELDLFLANCRAYAAKRDRPTYLIHLLSIYPPGEQKYGRDKFTTLDEIVGYFNLATLESGLIRTANDSGGVSLGTYFVAKI